MLDDIVDQKKVLGLIYQSIVYGKPSYSPRHSTTKTNALRALDILVGREVHGMLFKELALEYNLSSSRIQQIHAKTMRQAHDVLRVNMLL